MKKILFFLLLILPIITSCKSKKEQEIISFDKAEVLFYKQGSNDQYLTLNLEYAHTIPQMQRGLMFRTDLTDESGMLFNYGIPRIASMWMKNTPTSLDMIFFNEQGIVTEIITNTTPFSLDHIVSINKIKYVVELKANMAKKFNIEPNDKMIYVIK
ncbi:MAG: DUF192 domain-containing protein [Alphaproteobacteria bacterium]|nr:DUF192 domain-containing protein [Alphaproteobacteria bacterium]